MNAGQGNGRRYLIATAVAHHHQAPQWDRPGLVEARQEIIDLFTGPLGYTHVSDLGLDPTRDQLTSRLRAFCRSAQRQPEDMLAVYLACHGEVLDGSGDHVLLTCDTSPDDIADALPTVELARKMLLDTPVRRVLLMLDTCYSGQGGHELAAAALTRLTRHWHNETGCALVVITSTQPAQQAQTGAFPALFRQAVNDLSNAGLAPATLPLDSLIKSINTNPQRPGFQTISSTIAQLTGTIPPFLPNPRHDPRMTEVDLAIQQASEWDAQDEQRDIEYRTRLLVRAMGSHHQSQGWWFSGRHAALIDLTHWLTHPDPARPMLAITAGPGSGKTAVLGLVATLTHPERRRTVPLDGLALPHAAVPPTGSVDLVVYAQNLTTEQVLQAIAAVVRVNVTKPGELLETLTDRETPMTVLVDALDEASHPEELTRQLLRPLAKHSQGQLRLLVGTRPHLLDNLNLRREDSIDLDAPRYADLDALTTYAARGLLNSHPNSPYLGQTHLLRPIAEVIATAAEPSFLVARITSSTLAAERAIPDPHDPAWRRSLPSLPGPAMQRDLQRRLGEHADRVRDLLRPLAFAEGQGLPWEDIWAPLASRIANKPYIDQDLFWLRQTAGSYVVEATEADRSAYRLYHQALAEHLRDGTDDDAIQKAFIHVLLSRVPVTADGTRDWSHAHPYTLRHLATHAARCGLLDEIIADANYLVYAHPDQLLAALHTVTTDDARLTRAIYRASAALHRTLTAPERRQMLATDAARFNAPSHQHTLAQSLKWAPRWATGQQTSTALHATLTGHQAGVRAVACTQLNGRPFAVTGSDDKTVRVWDLTTETLHATLNGHQGSVEAVACTQLNGRPIAVTSSSDDKTVRVWDLTTETLHATLNGHQGSVEDLGWIEDGDRPVLAVACTEVDGLPIAVTSSCFDRTVRVWDLTTGTLHATLNGHQGPVFAVACTEMDGRPIAVTGSFDWTMRVWDLTTGTLQTTVNVYPGLMGLVACTEVDGLPIAVTSSYFEGAMGVRDLATGDLQATLAGHQSPVAAVVCTEIDRRPIAVASCFDGTAWVWDLTTGDLQATIPCHQGPVAAVACTEIDGRPIAVTGSDDKTVRVWILENLASEDQKARGHTEDIRAAACTEVDGRPIVVTGSGDETVRVWDLTTGDLQATIPCHQGPVAAVACTEIDGRPIAVTCGAGPVRVWDLTTGTLQTTLNSPQPQPTPEEAVACTQMNGRAIAVTGSNDGTVEVWDLATGTLQTTLTGTRIPNAVWAVACSEMDGRPIAVTGDDDGTVRVWDLTTGTLQNTLTGHQSEVLAVACTEVNGRPIVVTGSRDGTVQVWELTTGDLQATLTGPRRPVWAVACTEVNGRPIVVTGSVDGTVRVWDLLASQQITALHFAGVIVGALCIGPAQEIITGIGWDVVVTDWRTTDLP